MDPVSYSHKLPYNALWEVTINTMAVITLNNISVNRIDFKINTSFNSTSIQFCYVLNILLPFILETNFNEYNQSDPI